MRLACPQLIKEFPEGYSSIGRASVSKTEGWGFETLCPCQVTAPYRA